MNDTELALEIRRLAAARQAVILAHNYCRGEVQDVADYTGDSLELARCATQVEAEVIVFCGVYFMAETAAILNPDKTVLIPDPSAGCPMADMITAAQLRELKAKHPGAKAVCYVNSTAEVKAECDICVTSGNAEKVLATMKGEEILFVPDQHLGAHVAAKFGATWTLWPGYCPIHARLTPEDLARARAAAGDGACVWVHPECAAAVRSAADACLSTGGMCQCARETSASTIIVGTERGILHRLQKENPAKRFVAAGDLICPDMKKVTLENLAAALRNLSPRVTVDAVIASRARRAIEAMLAIS